jgi:AcrR family transcriptional regulator
MVCRNTVMSTTTDDGTARVFRALERGELDASALTTRRVCALLGYTTGHLYHHYGSLDVLLAKVAELAFVKLSEQLQRVANETRDIGAVAQAFVEFGIENGALYSLMFERQVDWNTLRARGLLNDPSGMALWRQLVSSLTELGAREPLEDARLLIAGLHGLVSFALSGRANVGALEVSDREAALRSARRLAALVCPARRTVKSKLALEGARRALSARRTP